MIYRERKHNCIGRWLCILFFVIACLFSGFCTATAQVHSAGQSEAAAIVEKRLAAGESADVTVNVPAGAVYTLWVEFCYDETETEDARFALYIDGVLPLEEAASLSLCGAWIQPNAIQTDRYGNEITPLSSRSTEMLYAPVQDAAGRRAMPFTFSLTEGEHSILMQCLEGSVWIQDIRLCIPETPPEDQCAEATGDALVVIEAEHPLLRNDAAINASAEFSAALSPNDPKKRRINFLTGLDTPGQAVSYMANVPEDGWYQITIHCRQKSKVGLPVLLSLRVNGLLPSKGALALEIPYAREFGRTVLQSGDQPYTVYLTKGEHLLSFTVNGEHQAPATREIRSIIDGVNGLVLEVTQLTSGSNGDLYRDYRIDQNIPDAAQRLTGWARRLEAQAEQLAEEFGEGAREECSYLLTAAGQLLSLAEETEKLPLRLTELNGSSSSVLYLLSEQLTQFNRHGLDMDWIALHQMDAELPAEPSFLEKTKFSFSRFIASMSAQDYEAGQGKSEALQVWMGRPRPYVETLQVLIDSEFTPTTGIQVDLSIMSDPNKLVLSTAAGNGPDAVLSMQYVLPSYLNIRGALLDLTQFEDFGCVAERFPLGLFVPYTLEDGVYALPETVNTYVLFYRKDLLQALHLEVPDTMQEVRGMIPVLRQNGMNFYYPTAGMGGVKWFSGTMPLIWQHGGSIYGDTVDKTALAEEEALSGFVELTELFTIGAAMVDMPSPGFYQAFRTGTVPVGVSDISTYIMLREAAPEIDNLWGIALFPGVEDENGVVQRHTSGGAETMAIMSSTEQPEEAWAFLKWWSSAEVQAEFARRLRLTYGGTYLWPTANIQAFDTLPITAADKSIFSEQINWSVDAPWVPGTYMLERELSNAFLSVVTQGTDARRALDMAIKAIDRETERKLEEFGYMKDGQVIRELKTPTQDVVLKLVEQAAEEENE